jgi:hypothetical protein
MGMKKGRTCLRRAKFVQEREGTLRDIARDAGPFIGIGDFFEIANTDGTDVRGRQLPFVNAVC